MTISPTIITSSIPGLEISTNVRNMSYEALLLTFGPVVYYIEYIYYSAGSFPQFYSPLQYNVYNANGNQAGQDVFMPISPVQYQPSMVLKLTETEIILNRQSSINFNLLPLAQVDLFFYGERKRNQDPIDKAGFVNNYNFDKV